MTVAASSTTPRTRRSPAAAAGASIGGATTGADGTAQVTLDQRGHHDALTATKGDQVRDEATVTVTDPPASGTPDAAPVLADRRADADPSPVARGRRAASLLRRPGHPRAAGLPQARAADAAATVDEPVDEVTLGLTRQVGHRCWRFDDARGEVRAAPGAAVTRASRSAATRTISYLLPERLRKGRYVLDVVSKDPAGNVEQLARGRNRVVFFVR